MIWFKNVVSSLNAPLDLELMDRAYNVIYA